MIGNGSRPRASAGQSWVELATSTSFARIGQDTRVFGGRQSESSTRQPELGAFIGPTTSDSRYSLPSWGHFATVWVNSSATMTREEDQFGFASAGQKLRQRRSVGSRLFLRTTDRRGNRTGS